MRGHWPASRAAKRQRRRPENGPRHCRARRRPAHCSARQASASSARCLRSSAPDAASISRLANMSLARAFHASPPSQNGTAAACHTRLHRTKHALEICIGQRLSHGARRLACGGRIGPPYPNRLVSACWGASEIGSDFLNGGLRPRASFREAGPPHSRKRGRSRGCALLGFSRLRHRKETPPCGSAAASSESKSGALPSKRRARIAWRTGTPYEVRENPSRRAQRKRGAKCPGLHGRGGHYPAGAACAAIWRAPARSDRPEYRQPKHSSPLLSKAPGVP